ncbi:MAG TPA: hypothetical protein VGM37_05765 [Armatimonadota bacterium]|jgi:hypothetical protein
MKTARLLLSGLLLLAVPPPARPAIPRTVTLQGILLDKATQQPKPDGAYTATLTLYDGSAQAWQEVKALQVFGGRGYFTAVLGEPGGLPLTVTFDRPYTLGIQLQGEASEMTPRLTVHSVPYALNAVDNPLGLPFSATGTLPRPGALFAITNSGSGAALKGMNTGPTNSGSTALDVGAAVVGVSAMAGTSGTIHDPRSWPGGAGVYGENNQLNGAGVRGAAMGPGGAGVQGVSTSGDGLFGSSTNGNGARLTSVDGPGLYASSDSDCGVQGYSNKNVGVLGLTLSPTGGPAVRGDNYSPDNTEGKVHVAAGVMGTSSVAGGWTTEDVPQFLEAGMGVYGEEQASYGTGVRGVANGKYGVGVQGESEHATGIGVLGSATGPLSGVGVKGTSVDGYGVLGTTDQGTIGVWGLVSENAATTWSYGVYGRNDHVDGKGVYGSADGTNSRGVWGDSIGGTGGYFSSRGGRAGYFNGKVEVDGDLSVAGNITATGRKSFRIDHPLDPANKYLVHAAVESPEMKTIYDGAVTTDAVGEAIVTLPDYFQALNRDYRYQLTCVGEFAQAIVARKIDNNRFTIKTDKPNVEVCWQVTGIRNDAYARDHPMEVEPEKTEAERAHYLSPNEPDQPEGRPTAP